MYNPLKNLSDSLKVAEGGYSGRKLTALVLTLCVIAMHYFLCRYAFVLGNFGLFISVLVIDLVGIAFFLLLIDVKQIIELKNGRKTSETTAEANTTSDTKGPDSLDV